MDERERPDYAERIVQDPNILTGKRTVRGTRLAVELVLDAQRPLVNVRGFVDR